jgi:hypothetical protein
MLHVIGPFGDQLPAACQNSCQEVWSIFDKFISKYAFDYDTVERTTRVLRHGITLFGQSTFQVAPAVLSCMVTSFEATGFSTCLWIAGKLVGRFGRESDPTLRSAFLALSERSTKKTVSVLLSKAPRDVPDGKRSHPSLFSGEPNVVGQFWRTTFSCSCSCWKWSRMSFSSLPHSHWHSKLPWQLLHSFIRILFLQHWIYSAIF